MHNVSTSITIRNIPDRTRDELASRAALSGRSLQEYLKLRLIELATTPDAESLVLKIRARKYSSEGSVPSEHILEFRNEDRS